jgi:hypothetical protein
MKYMKTNVEVIMETRKRVNDFHYLIVHHLTLTLFTIAIIACILLSNKMVTKYNAIIANDGTYK